MPLVTELADTKPQKEMESVSSNVTHVQAICPHCNVPFKQPPKTKKQCPSCKNAVYARVLPSTKEMVFVVETEATRIDSEWREIRRVERWLNDLGSFGITKDDFQNLKTSLMKQYGGANPKESDVLWALMQKLVISTAQRNPENLSGLYYSMALFLDEEGKNPFPLLQQSRKSELKRYQSGGVKKVEILTCSEASCKICRKLKSKIYTIKEALEKMPIPVKECMRCMENESKHGFCRCCYVAYFK